MGRKSEMSDNGDGPQAGRHSRPPWSIPDGALPDLTREEIERYSRHLIMPEVGMKGQRKMKSASVLMIGAGGLGSPLGLYLAAAGIGKIGIVDFDVVDHTNLQRQVLHGTKDVGRSKLQSARERIHDVNPNVEVETHQLRLTSENAMQVIEPYDVVVDGTDNFPTRYLTNDACVLLGKPNVYGSIFRFEGQVSVFDASKGPCYRCLFREPPPPGMVPSCAEGGVLGVLPGIIGSLQALETIKLIIGEGDPMIGRLLLFDALAMQWRTLALRKNPDCPVCGTNPTVTELIDYLEFCGVSDYEEGAEERDTEEVPTISAGELHARLERGDDLRLVDVRQEHEWEIVNLGDHGATLIPLDSLLERVSELDSADEIVLHCQGGTRSAKALRQLKEAGFRRVWNLRGGILAWQKEVDPSLPRY
jgi:molybdopterin/thiamine biosynthesis adenylyltransferase/rhodanese-related sulfurtransferase